MDVIERVIKIEMGHVAKRIDKMWTKEVLEWYPL